LVPAPTITDEGVPDSFVREHGVEPRRAHDFFVGLDLLFAF